MAVPGCLYFSWITMAHSCLRYLPVVPEISGLAKGFMDLGQDTFSL